MYMHLLLCNLPPFIWAPVLAAATLAASISEPLQYCTFPVDQPSPVQSWLQIHISSDETHHSDFFFSSYWSKPNSSPVTACTNWQTPPTELRGKMWYFVMSENQNFFAQLQNQKKKENSMRPFLSTQKHTPEKIKGVNLFWVCMSQSQSSK